MPHIHIALVGGQPAPIYNGIVATQPDKIVYIYSSGSYNTMQKVIHEIKIEYRTIELAPVDLLQIDKTAYKLAEEYANDEVTVNISSGTKTWSHFFALAFDKHPRATVVFMDQNNVLWDFTHKTYRDDFNFDMLTQFRLYGNSLEGNYVRFADYTDEDRKAACMIENIRAYNISEFNAVFVMSGKRKVLCLKEGQNGFISENGSYVEWDELTPTVVKIGLNKKNKPPKSWVLKSPNIQSLIAHSGWFEFKIANILSKWSKTKDILMNCRFPSKGGNKNEVDIIVNAGNKILFVECKTQINQPTDIDKFRSVVKSYGGMSSKALFVTDAKMKTLPKLKCEEHDILSFSIQDEHLGLSSEEALYLLLDNELFNINTK